MAEEPSLSELIEQLKRIRIQRAERVLRAERDQSTRAVHNFTYQIGDRVRITNGVRAGQVNTGIVTGVTATRVSITTDDGTRTWRAHGNIAFAPC
jgi:hypothetical protein